MTGAARAGVALGREQVLQAVAGYAASLDRIVAGHAERTRLYVDCLGRALATHAYWGPGLDESSRELMARAAVLHDIGKIGIPDAILLKADALGEAECEAMREHPRIGWRLIDEVERRCGESIPYLAFAKQIAAHHHERWDGRGYPDRLAGEAIPLAARIMAVADVYDALVSRRSYKEAWSHARAEALVRAGRGTQFDPAVVDAFRAQSEDFRAIARAHGVPEAAP